jgi:hypothetical protein
MSYIGNQITAVPFQIDVYSGNASQVTFGPLVRAPTVASIAVFISGVYKTPGIDYTVNADYITFTSAPASGTNNIVIHHIGNGFMATQVPGDGTVTSGKIVEGAITGNLIGTNAISGNNISQKSINASNSIVELSVTGNLIGTGAISANNFAGGGITSNVLSPNLTLTLTRTNETTNLFSTAPAGNINIDVANTTLYYFTSNTTANVTFNLRANNVNTFDSVIQTGETVTVTIMLRHSTTSGGRHAANVYIDGGLITTNRITPDQAGANNIFYVGNLVPVYAATVPGTGVEMNMFNISVFKRAANTYTVFLSNTTAQIG